MNCPDIEPLFHAERDGLLTATQQAEVARHVATCPLCQQRQTQLNAALAAFQADAASVAMPSADEAWRELQTNWNQTVGRPVKKRPLAPVIWFGTSLAAAAALALVFWGPHRPATGSPVTGSSLVAQADYVEAGTPHATTMVFSDQESGWLVVWAEETAPQSRG